MKNYLFLFVINLLSVFCNAQKVDLSKFNMSNITSPAFVLVGGAPTEIYTTENIKALAIHTLDNFGESMSIEVSPYFLLSTESKDRTYYKYIGLEKTENDLIQRPFSGLNTTTISFAYVNKNFDAIDSEKKTYTVGLRTTILRFYDKEKVYNNAIGMSKALAEFTVPQNVLISGEEAIKEYYDDHQEELNKLFEPYQKTIKPIFKLDGALGYSALFKENTLSSSTVNRFGIWLTGEFSQVLNEGADSKYNNYINILLTSRYINDGFNLNSTGNYFDENYNDFGGKIALDFGKFSFGYEFISRNGTIDSERSVGDIKFMISNNVSISGGFGKDFELEDNLVTVFGINWGFNMGGNKIPINK